MPLIGILIIFTEIGPVGPSGETGSTGMKGESGIPGLDGATGFKVSDTIYGLPTCEYIAMIYVQSFSQSSPVLVSI